MYALLVYWLERLPVTQRIPPTLRPRSPYLPSKSRATIASYADFLVPIRPTSLQPVSGPRDETLKGLWDHPVSVPASV